MPTPFPRALLGFLAGALAVVTFHQGMVQLLHAFGLTSSAAYSFAPVPPFGVPRMLNLCFWGGLYGVVLGLARPRLPAPLWLSGVVLGIIASLAGMTLVAWIKGNPVMNNWAAWPIARSLIVNAAWGLGTGLFLTAMLPRRGWRRAMPATG
jgi:hypothetical protein